MSKRSNKLASAVISASGKRKPTWTEEDETDTKRATSLAPRWREFEYCLDPSVFPVETVEIREEEVLVRTACNISKSISGGSGWGVNPALHRLHAKSSKGKLPTLPETASSSAFDKNSNAEWSAKMLRGAELKKASNDRKQRDKDAKIARELLKGAISCPKCNQPIVSNRLVACVGCFTMIETWIKTPEVGVSRTYQMGSKEEEHWKKLAEGDIDYLVTLSHFGVMPQARRRFKPSAKAPATMRFWLGSIRYLADLYPCEPHKLSVNAFAVFAMWCARFTMMTWPQIMDCYEFLVGRLLYPNIKQVFHEAYDDVADRGKTYPKYPGIDHMNASDGVHAYFANLLYKAEAKKRNLQGKLPVKPPITGGVQGIEPELGETWDYHQFCKFGFPGDWSNRYSVKFFTVTGLLGCHCCHCRSLAGFPVKRIPPRHPADRDLHSLTCEVIDLTCPTVTLEQLTFTEAQTPNGPITAATVNDVLDDE